MSDYALRVMNLRKSFGGITALKDVTFTVPVGSIVGLIGPNGSGKSTLVNCVTGYYRPDGGRVFYFGRDITGIPAHRTVHLGIARTFQQTRLYWNMTTYQNLRIAALPVYGEELNPRVIEEQLELFELLRHRDTVARQLSLFDKKKLEIATRLISKPKLLLLDEPAAGLSPEESDRLLEVMRTLRQRGLTMILIEHTMRLIFTISDKVVVLSGGVKIAEGVPSSILEDEAVIEAYLGSYRHG